jgi:hypothetical protein
MSDKSNRIHLPGTIQQPLLLEVMEFTKGFVARNKQLEKVDLSNLLFVCSLLCNLIQCALLSRYLFYLHTLSVISFFPISRYNNYMRVEFWTNLMFCILLI